MALSEDQLNHYRSILTEKRERLIESAKTTLDTEMVVSQDDRFDEVEDRLTDWQSTGLLARSGVETFYNPVLPGDLEASVATSLWQAWISEFLRLSIDDELFPGVNYPTGDTGRTRLLTLMLEGRGPDNPEGMASWVKATGESAYFDILDTPEIETSHEVMLLALASGLDALAEPSTEPGYGGYGTTDMSEYLWGMRHMVRFESLLVEAIGNDPSLAFLLDQFNITPEVLPLAANLASDDPRAELPWFPRHGDMLNVDAGNPGFGLDDHTYGSGPVFRMVIALGPDGAEGVNILPGGQSGLNDSEHFADQAAAWLGNETWPMHTTVDAVLGDQRSVQRFSPVR